MPIELHPDAEAEIAITIWARVCLFLHRATTAALGLKLMYSITMESTRWTNSLTTVEPSLSLDSWEEVAHRAVVAETEELAVPEDKEANSQQLSVTATL
jgi:hypothetical protein